MNALRPPSAARIVSALEYVARREQPVDPDELDRLVLEYLGRGPDDDVTRALLEDLSDRLIEEEVLAYLADDRMVHVGALTAGITLTHRLTPEEIETETIRLTPDLEPFWWHEDLRLADESVIEPYGVPGEIRWMMPPASLEGLAAGGMIGVQVTEDGLVGVTGLDAAPADDPELVHRARRAYDALIAEPGLPPYIKDIVYELLADDPHCFARPRPPLRDLCDAAGLEVRGDLVAHSEQLWEEQRMLHLWSRLYSVFGGDKHSCQQALEVLEAAADPLATRKQLRGALKAMLDSRIAQFVVDELAPPDEPDPHQLTTAGGFSRTLIDVAADGTPKAVAHWAAAVFEERGGRPHEAEDHLNRALAAGGDWPPVLERAAWYASDRGDAAQALRLLRRLPDPDPSALRMLEPLEGPGPHPLPDRVGWLGYKAASYALLRGGDATEELMMLAEQRAVDPDDEQSLRRAYEDPLIVDVLLTEGGWFEQFLSDRGALLPEDEALLAQTWVDVDRTVYEVEQVEPGVGMKLRDLATEARLVVRERTASRQLTEGSMICARAVPDGKDHQFIGGVFRVGPGSEDTVLTICGEGDPYELCSYISALGSA
ncbi:MAG: hypothetical protein WD602_05290 [Actinomycetota bacterium]